MCTSEIVARRLGVEASSTYIRPLGTQESGGQEEGEWSPALSAPSLFHIPRAGKVPRVMAPTPLICKKGN